MTTRRPGQRLTTSPSQVSNAGPSSEARAASHRAPAAGRGRRVVTPLTADDLGAFLYSVVSRRPRWEPGQPVGAAQLRAIGSHRGAGSRWE